MNGRAFIVCSAAAMLAACAGSPTEKRWSCSPGKGAFRSCASIREIDARSTPQPAQAGSPLTLKTLTGGEVFRVAPSDSRPGPAIPEREPDQVIRVVVAPWIDAAGDYHARSEIFAIARRGGWAVPVPAPPPPPVQAAGVTQATQESTP